ncbi:PH domain-containing protein [Alteromonas sp. A079]|uniref:PH domain-containing protein n=1 Tax=Alteromonas sp. A079 TaxID=3410268 RepID=UPI003BA2F952
MTGISSSATTTFSNAQLDPDSMPAMAALRLTDVSPRYRIVNVSLALCITTLLIAIICTLRFQPFFVLPEPLLLAFPFVLTGIITLGVVWVVYHVLADVRVKYSVREQDLNLQSGLLFQTLACQPILRVQHVEIKRGPLARLAGLASLQVFSAGGALHTFEIPGLPVETAQQLRQFVLDHKVLSAK